MEIFQESLLGPRSAEVARDFDSSLYGNSFYPDFHQEGKYLDKSRHALSSKLLQFLDNIPIFLL